jgi:hypothetical protein
MTSFNKVDRFDLEQAIMNAWATSEDLDLVYHNTDNLTLNPKDCDILQNQMLGLKYIFELRMEKVWDVFEKLTKQNGFYDRNDNIDREDWQAFEDWKAENNLKDLLEKDEDTNEIYYDPMA